MKRFVICFVALLGLAAPAFAEKYAQATFPEKEYDMGYINETGGPVSCEFEFVNTGNKPLIIKEAVASCGCTRPEYPKRPIQPGKSAKIKVTYNPLGRPGAFRKDIRVKTNGKEGKTTLYIIGSVLPATGK